MLIETLEDPIVQIHKELLRHRHFYLAIVIMLHPVENITEIDTILRYLYMEKFVNSDIYYVNASSQQDEVFGFTTYPEFAKENKTHLVGNVREFYHKIVDKTDLQGYRFETPLMMDAPKVVRYRNRNGELRIQGVAYNIIKMCLEYLNASLVESHLVGYSSADDSIVDMQMVLDEVRQHKVELAAHAYALFNNDDDVQKSYPILVVNWCLMVPINNKIFTMFYPLMPFEWSVWFTIVVAFTLVNSVSYIFLKFHHLDSRNFILINFCKFINTSPPAGANYHGQDSWFQMVLQGFIFFQGFFIASFYTSTLGSFLAVTKIKSDINNLHDVIHNHLPIMIIDYELDFLISQRFDLPKKFFDLLRPVNSSTFYFNQLHLNTSQAYFTTYDMWHFLNMQQAHLRPPIFRYTDICFGDYHLAFPMVSESPIWRDIEYLMFRIHSSGLYYYHERKSFEYAHRAGVIEYRLEDDSFHTVGFQHLRMVVGFLLGGSVMACLAFLHELWSFRKKNRKNI
ncbi:uncharacterized protein LOC142239378 [Haematobia irritans]|uniref:uncharacterized protein LOC142239378 n=1 Tax=Haematobia irritans TaxID=7368 RepID=UPI003F4FA4E6